MTMPTADPGGNRRQGGEPGPGASSAAGSATRGPGSGPAGGASGAVPRPATQTPRSSAAPSRSAPPRTSSSSSSRAGKTTSPPRRAALQLRRIDPWTALKISLIVSIVMFFVWMIAVGVLYLSLDGLDVWDKINTTYNTLVVSAETAENAPDLITPGSVFGVTAVIGAINIVLFTALSAIAAFVYNAAAGLAGGVELTLSERE